jgi:antitoxin PrlF
MESTLTTKGQVTLPKELRDALHLKTGDKIVFQEMRDGSYVLKPKLRLDVRSLKGLVSYSGPAKTLDDMERAIREQGRRGSI